MIQAEISFADLQAPVELIGGGIFMASSVIRPYSHRLLQSIVFDAGEQIAVAIFERMADEAIIPLSIVRTSPSVLSKSVAGIKARDFDFAIFTINRTKVSLTYEASPVVSAPVFMRSDRARAHVDWDYERLLSGQDANIVWPMAIAQVLGQVTYGPSTIVSGVYRATAAAAVTIKPSGISTRLPENVEHSAPREIIAGSSIESAFFDTIKLLLASRDLPSDKTAVELSGGMDSALTAIAAAQAISGGLVSVSAQFSGTMGDAQRERRHILRKAGAFQELVVPAERLAPFSPASRRRYRYGVWPDDVSYPEIFEVLFAALQASGIDTIISGFGGDELYVIYEGEEPAPRPALNSGCSLVTASGYALLHEVPDRYPSGWFQETSWLAAAGQSQRLLRHGIWPIYPYINEALAQFVSQLPYRSRRDRALLRKALKMTLQSPIFDTDYVKESFESVARHGIAANQAYLTELVNRSSLGRSSYINPTAVHHSIENVETIDRDTFNCLFRLLKIAAFFQ